MCNSYSLSLILKVCPAVARRKCKILGRQVLKFYEKTTVGTEKNIEHKNQSFFLIFQHAPFQNKLRIALIFKAPPQSFLCRQSADMSSLPFFFQQKRSLSRSAPCKNCEVEAKLKRNRNRLTERRTAALQIRNMLP